MIKVYSEDETSRALEVPSDITARDVCQLLILKNHYVDDNSWTLFEYLSHTGVGKDTGSLSNSFPSGYTPTRWQRLSSCAQKQMNYVWSSPFSFFIGAHGGQRKHRTGTKVEMLQICYPP